MSEPCRDARQRKGAGRGGGAAVVPKRSGQRQRSVWINLLVTLAVPIGILTQLSGEERLGPLPALCLALAFPLSYGLWAFARERRVDGFALLGIANVLLTGSLAVLGASAQHIAIKEAAVPGALSLAVLISGMRGTPLVRALLWQPQLFRVDAIAAALEAQGNARRFERRMRRANHWVAASFALSSALNYALASVLLSSPPGTVDFNQEFARMTALSYPVIALPCTALLVAVLAALARDLKRLTGLRYEQLFSGGTSAKREAAARAERSPAP